MDGNTIEILDKEDGNMRYWFGGIFFGLGWGLVGSCPEPIFVLLGSSVTNVLFVLFGTLFGTFLYGLFKGKLTY